MALALYRKYRPRTFAEVIGQDHVTEPLSQALRSGRLHHAYLFSGPRGCGKTSSARILARSLNCEQGPTPEPCGVCASCRSLANDGAGSIDVIEIDAASHGGVDDARDLREKAFFAPVSSRYKIYVIDEAHMVSSAGFNALLKLVEEPPDYVKFIFATTEPEKVLGTIRSRTHHYPFRLIPPAILRPYLAQLTEAEGVHVEPAVFPLVVRAGGGSARDTLSVLDQLIAGAGPDGVSYARAVALLGVTDVALIDEMCDALAAGDGAAAYATIDRVAEAGHDARRFASDLLERLRDLIILQQVPDAVAKGLIDGPTDQLDAMGAQATRLGPATLSRCADIVHNGLIEMRGTTAPRLLLELITARMLLPGAEDSTGALLQRLERMERRLTLSDTAAPQTSHDVRPVAAPAAPSGGGISAARAAASRRAPAGEGQPAAQSEPVAAARRAPGAEAAAGSAEPARPAEPGGQADDVPASLAEEPAPDVDEEPAEAPRVAPQARRPEPAGVLPDAPEEPVAVETGVPGQLSAAAIRETWPEIITAVGRQSKKIAALASGATVRELEGQTVVLTFRFPAHAKMVAAQPDLISNALYEALGGRWQIRCDVAGEAGAIQVGGPPAPSGQPQAAPAQAPPAQGAPARSAPVQQAPVQQAPARNAGSENAESRSGAASGGSPRNGAAQGGSARTAPAQARPPQGGSVASQREVAPAAQESGDGDDWPEPARPGGFAPEPDDSPAEDSGAGTQSGGGATAGGLTAVGVTGGATPGGATAGGLTAAGVTGGATLGGVTAEGATPGSAPPGGHADSTRSGSGPNAGPGLTGGGGANGGPAAVGSPAARGAAAARGGIAAARAAAAGARNGAAKPDPAKSAAWSDGSPAEEPPYDPDYDGPVRPGASNPGQPPAAGFEGFDPGDEPLDDVIDEKTARQSSEQQAMQLLQDAFGAEKIGES